MASDTDTELYCNRSGPPKLKSPDNYHEWFRAVKKHIAAEWWPCFDPEGTQQPPHRPNPPDETLLAPPSLTPASTPTVGPASGTRSATSTQSTASSTEELRREVNEWKLYQLKYARCSRYEKEETKINKILVSTVPPQYYPYSEKEQTPRLILQKVKKSLAPSSRDMRRKTRGEYRRLSSKPCETWPKGGPDSWIDDWHKLMSECDEWNPELAEEWAECFVNVWGRHPDVFRTSSWLQGHIYDKTLDGISKEDVAGRLRADWKRHLARAPASKRGGTHRGVFHTGATYDGKSPEDQSGEDDEKTPSSSKSRKGKKRSHKRQNPTRHEQQERKKPGFKGTY